MSAQPPEQSPSEPDRPSATARRQPRFTVARTHFGRGRHARPRIVRRLALPWRDPYAVFRGPHRRKAISAAVAAVALLGVAVAAVPDSAVAQTVHPTTPGSSVFTAAREAAPLDNLVQVAAPSPYRPPGGIRASQQAVTVARNLAPATPAAPQPTPPEAAAAPAPPAWSAPVPGARISYLFGVPDSGYAAGYHTGVDFAVDSGTPVDAVGAATVVSATWDGAYGNEVVLRLTDGRFAQYAHLSHLDVEAGQQVSAGQRLGASGSTGNSTGPHLHFEIRTVDRYGAVLDPVAYLTAHGVRDL
ncbi:M23 family metallopeptidase [Kitasatospora kifunensis]|uniref:Murein DD-endopeptidase MepM/ murein hydrolase activator NlpD n=1 Tax=Kitasatospora kifunensis TaxID=58351 RepID=A0A7W7VWT8_KITKI|nr:M23 family metallopeptidase [Kitasatospora kifunensis]MBB4925034.1 murein DD-endopeptidase MepM/ murein hydrolase activator NlpD [Kitasatospora kifunensis]